MSLKRYASGHMHSKTYILCRQDIPVRTCPSGYLCSKTYTMMARTYSGRCPGCVSRICPGDIVYVLVVSIEIVYVLEYKVSWPLCLGDMSWSAVYVLLTISWSACICLGAHILHLYVLATYMSW